MPPPPPPPIQGATTERSSRWDTGASHHNSQVPGSNPGAQRQPPMTRSRSPSPRRDRSRSRSRSPRERRRSRSGSWGADKAWPSREERRAERAAAAAAAVAPPPPPPPPPNATTGFAAGGWVGQQMAAASAAAHLNLNLDGGRGAVVGATVTGDGGDGAPGASWGGEVHGEWDTRGGAGGGGGENGEDTLAANPASPSSDAGGGGKAAAAMAQSACGALAKGLLRSLWKEGVVSRDVFKTICKKVRASQVPCRELVGESERGRPRDTRWGMRLPRARGHSPCAMACTALEPYVAKALCGVFSARECFYSRKERAQFYTEAFTTK